MKRVKSMTVSTARSSGRTVRKFRVGNWIIEVTCRAGWGREWSINIRAAGRFPNLFTASGSSCLSIARQAREWCAEQAARHYAGLS